LVHLQKKVNSRTGWFCGLAPLKRNPKGNLASGKKKGRL